MMQEELDKALLEAAKAGGLEKMKELIAAGAKVCARGFMGSQPMHEAAKEGCLSVVKFLAWKFPATAESMDGYGYTALHWAARCGRERIMEFLVGRFPALVEARTNDEETALHLAAGFGHADAVEILLKHGADPTAKNKFGKLPLGFFAKGYPEVWKLLQEAEKGWNTPGYMEKLRGAAFVRMRDQQRKLGALRPKGPSL